MIIIRSAEDLARALSWPQLQPLLQAHADRLAAYDDFALEDLAMFAIVQPGDDINTAIGWALLENDTFVKPVELITQHGGWYEVTFILSDDGFGLVLFVPVEGATDRMLLAACERALSEFQEQDFP